MSAPRPRTETKRVAHAMRRAIVRNAERLGQGRLALGVSGGPDSLAMLLACEELGARLRARLVVAHFSHGLRPWSDRQEQALVRRAAVRLGLPFAAGEGYSGSSEASAREARYRFLGQVAAAYEASAVATAHTQDDQAETVLLRLARGTGLRGAGAVREMSARNVDGRELVLLRPLLQVTRAQTEAVCAEAGVAPARDGSNRRLRYARNRVRLRALKELAEVNGDVRSALAGFAERAAEDDALLERLARDAAARFEARSAGRVSWPKAELRKLPAPLQARALESAWRGLQGEGATLGHRKLEQAMRVVARGGEVSLGKGGRFVVGPGPLALMTRASLPEVEPSGRGRADC